MTLSEALEINAQQSETLLHLRAQLSEMASLYEQAQQRAGQLEHRIADLLRRLFGPRSERYEANQFFMDALLKEAEGAPEEVPVPMVAVKATERRKAAPHGRTEIPEHFEREEIVLDLPEERKVDAGGNPLVRLREEISEKIAWKPGSWFVKRYVRPVYVEADRQGESAGVYSAPMPDSPIDKSKADTSVLALVAVKKWSDHLPVYRQREIFLREGLQIAPSTLDAWAIEPMMACEPLYEALKAKVLSSPVLHTDDSPLRLQVPGRGSTKEARLWVYLSGVGPPLRLFDFTIDRRKERPGQILKDYKGFVQADAYAGYDTLFNSRDDIIEVGCWAHARRKFDEAKGSAPLPATEMLGRIRLLYEIERRVHDAPDAERLAARQKESVPLLEALFARVMEMSRTALPSSPLGKALTYARNQREALMRYTTDGRLRIDNNRAENAIRPLAIGRKNWLFAGSERGGKACAIALSLVQSAKALEINCYDYLHDVYQRIMSHPVNRLHELLPDEWKAARENKASAT